VQEPGEPGRRFVYTTNPAWCIYDYLASKRYGLGAPASEIDAASFATEATYYDTVVEKDNTVPTSGPLFSCNGVVDCGQVVEDNIKQLESSARATVIYQAGQFRIFTRRVVSPTSFALTEDNVHGDFNINIPGIGDAPNIIQALYIEPGQGPVVTAISNTAPISVTTQTAHNFSTNDRVYIYLAGTTPQGLPTPVLSVYFITVTGANTFTLNDTDAPGAGYNANSCRCTTENFPHQSATRIWPRPGTANGYLTQDNNYEVIHELSLPFTNDVYTAEQLGLVALKESRAGTTVTVTASEAALALQFGDLVPFTHPTPGWINKYFWVMGVMLMPDVMKVRLALLAYDSTAYALDPLSTVPTPPSTFLPNPFTCLPPTELELLSGNEQARPDRDATHKIFIKASWTASLDPYVEYYEVQYRRGGKDAWLPGGRVPQPGTECEVGPVTEGSAYDVQVCAVNTLGVSSSFLSDTITPEFTELRGGSIWIESFSAETPGRRWEQIAGTGSIVDAYDPDAEGGTVGRITGPVMLQLADRIPFDPNLLFILRDRIRQYRDPTTGGKLIYLGLAGFAQKAGQNGVYDYINVIGAPSSDNQHFVLANGKTLPASRTFTDYWAFVKGHAGGKFPLTAAMLTGVGLGSFDATKCVNGSTDPTNIAFSTDASVAGAVLQMDLGVPKYVTEVRLHAAAAGSLAEFDLEFSDSAAGPWSKARTGIVANQKGWEHGPFRILAAATPGDPPPPDDDGGGVIIVPGTGRGRTACGLTGLLTDVFANGPGGAIDAIITDSNGVSFSTATTGYFDRAKTNKQEFLAQVTGGSQSRIKDANGDFSPTLFGVVFNEWADEVESVTGGLQRMKDAVTNSNFLGILMIDDLTTASPPVHFSHAVGYDALEAAAKTIKDRYPWMPTWSEPMPRISSRVRRKLAPAHSGSPGSMAYGSTCTSTCASCNGTPGSTRIQISTTRASIRPVWIARWPAGPVET
jgi:hypothetical protein